MKKVVRLTENDLERLVQKIIKEEGEEQKIELLKTKKGELLKKLKENQHDIWN